MTDFRQKPGTKSSSLHLKEPFPDVYTFDAIVRSLVLRNPLGCISYIKAGKNHKPVEPVREMYTAKFVYMDPKGKKNRQQLGSLQFARGVRNRYRVRDLEHGKHCIPRRESETHPGIRSLLSYPAL
jgi:hypothetical protein